MKRFLVKLFLFSCIPLAVWAVAEALLPVTTFTHRHYEAVEFTSGIPVNSLMYPGLRSSMMAVGDLCHHTRFAVCKKEDWRTDAIGYRNDVFVEDPDVLLIGDSFFEGSGLTQEDMVSARVQARLGDSLKVYCMAPAVMSGFERLYKSGTIKKPRLIVYSMVERYMPPPPLEAYVPQSAAKQLVKKALEWGHLNMYLDKIIKHYSIKWLRARIHGSKGTGMPGRKDSSMFFLNTSQKYDPATLAPTVKQLAIYRDYCAALGIGFLFVPMANKETVYYDLIPLDKQPDYLLRLDSMLQAAHIKTIHTLKLYNDYRKTHNALLYHRDDTHWNATGADLIASEIVKSIRSENQYKPAN